METVIEQKYESLIDNNHIFVDQQQFTIELQKYYSALSKNSKKTEWTEEKIKNVIKLIDDYNIAKLRKKRPTDKQYHHAKKYDIFNVGSEKILIMNRKSQSDSVIQIIPSSEYYYRILDAHIATGHGRRDKIVHALKNKYVVPIFAITIFLRLCKICLSKKSLPKSGTAGKSMISDEINSRGYIDLVDFQSAPDGDYKWLLQYQDHLTKFCFLRPLRSKEVRDVALEILKIFLEVGYPDILLSDNGREFTASVLKEIISLWPSCKTINGIPKNTENSNQVLKNMIWAWMKDNNSTKWSMGCYFVQYQMNSSYNSSIARTPFKALFGNDPRSGPSFTNSSENINYKLETEEFAEEVLEDTNDNNHVSLVENRNIIPVEITCHICNQEASEAQACVTCKRNAHAICGTLRNDEHYGSQFVCYTCINSTVVKQETTELYSNLKRAAEEIIS
ncbi:unnamed protein product [Euphydryas editha]|uniref:Integrase catalytic domain-containing protein n=1 Tax=Euphydryas editha TaxID=104508 RepID=A0AAU9UM93_EUPED|nr:unnamed protein product [Euphydryas editha]